MPGRWLLGGDANHLTEELVESARCLALYKAMKDEGKTAWETGKILYDCIVETGYPVKEATPIPPSERLTREELMERRKARAQRSQKRIYPEDWVYQFVEGNGSDFDYGYDFTECAIQKFYHAQSADEFLRFYCFLDFAKSAVFGTGLSRTQTLAEGYAKCNHRFKQGRTPGQQWPPRFLG